ncbi:hypothetical protein [Nocardiopsis synnemataformans]|uniref:hypothetical protein n=1 Tax=Nocardiopsis synnemataformans TaxID=61305 RepID=UPI003EBC596D
MAEEYGVFTTSPITADTSYARLMRRHAPDGAVASGPDAGSQLTLTANASSQLTLGTGYAMVGGWWYRTDAPVPITVPPNAASQPRRDLVVIRADTAAAGCYPHIIQGTPGSSSWPAPTRDPSGTWDVVLGRYTIAGGSAVVAPGDLDLSVRQWTTPTGAIPCTSQARPPDPWPGMLIAETDTGQVRVFLGDVWRLVSDTSYPTDWVPVVLAAGYGTPGHGHAPEVRWDAPGIIRMRGRIGRNGGQPIPNGDVIARVPAFARVTETQGWAVPSTSRRGGTASTRGNTSRLELQSGVSSPTSGQLILFTEYDPDWASLDGITYVV